MSEASNEQMILITGESGTGKSLSLMNLENPEGVLYLNCEGKRLPFKNKFHSIQIDEPTQIYSIFDQVPDNFHTIVIDTISFLMGKYESQYVQTAEDTRAAWGHYAAFLRNLHDTKIATAGKKIIILCHLAELHDEKKMEMNYRADIKGSIGKGQGYEAFFSTGVSVKKIDIEELEKYPSPFLNITEDDRDLGFKHVFKVRPTRETRNERMRGPYGLFSRSEPYMDNDANMLMKRLEEYYS